MNPSTLDIWTNPPPPGTEDRGEMDYEKSPKSKVLDEIDPYVKNPHYVEYEKHKSRSTHKHRRSRSHERKRSRSRSKDRHRHKKDRHRRSKSTSRSHHKRSRSRGHHHRHRSKSRSHSKHHKERRRKRSTSSSSRSSSRSPNYRSHHSKRSKRSRSRRSRSTTPYNIADYDNNEECDMKIEEENRENEMDEEDEEEAEQPKENVFKNDGSFLEMFKKMQEEQQKAEAAKQEAGTSEMKRPLPAFGKRRGGRVLKTGLVQKTKSMQDNESENPQDAWSIYMKEVKKYKEACCDDDSKTRPLVK